MYTAGEIEQLFKASGVSLVDGGVASKWCATCGQPADLRITERGPYAYRACECDEGTVEAVGLSWKDVAREVNEHINRHGLKTALAAYEITPAPEEPAPETDE